ncbi:hypothetical protein ZWY2020_040544 [Hordeum vulgare]|nr:hypothetical protein ZWY2020_040544 [Hordeum vulgare]
MVVIISRQRMHPVVLVPGYASNELDARLTEPLPAGGAARARGRRPAGSRFFLNYTALSTTDPAGVRCFADQMSTVYDAASDDYSQRPRRGDARPFFGSSTQGFRHP